MELTEIKYTRRNTIGGAGSYDYEVIEASAAVGATEDVAGAYRELKSYVEQQLTTRAYDHGPAAQAYIKTNGHSKAPKSTADQYCRWPGLPYNMSQKFKEQLKANGAWFNGKKNGGDNTWYCPKIPDGLSALAEWMEILQPMIPDGSYPEQDEDDIPF